MRCKGFHHLLPDRLAQTQWAGFRRVRHASKLGPWLIGWDRWAFEAMVAFPDRVTPEATDQICAVRFAGCDRRIACHSRHLHIAYSYIRFQLFAQWPHQRLFRRLRESDERRPRGTTKGALQIESLQFAGSGGVPVRFQVKPWVMPDYPMLREFFLDD